MKIAVRRTERVAQNDGMDQVVLALAQLVRDRWENERKGRLTRPRGLRIVGENDR